MASFMEYLLVAQITDTHLFSDPEQSLLGIKTEDSYRAVLAKLAMLSPRPDLLLMTGDLTQDGSEDSYIRLRDSLTALQIPTYWLPGNHDEVAIMQKQLAHGVISRDKLVQMKGWQILLLNSALPNQVYGYLSDASLDWLEQQLSNFPKSPTLVALHHPAFPLGSDWLDRIGLQNQSEFWQVCDRHPQVRVVLSGHAHQEFDQIYQREHNQVRCLVTPSTCIQFQPQNPKFQIDAAEPGFRLLRLYANGKVETEVSRLTSHKFQPDLAAVGY